MGHCSTPLPPALVDGCIGLPTCCPTRLQVILFWRGVWNSWDSLFGTDLASNIGSMVVGLIIMCIIRIFNLPLVEGLPGG